MLLRLPSTFYEGGVPLLQRKIAEYYLLISPPVISDHLSKKLIEDFYELNP